MRLDENDIAVLQRLGKSYGWILFVVWLVVGALPALIFRLDTKSGLLGDSFGMVNSLFSAFAFGGVVVAIILQTRELRCQREELELTRNELKASANAQINMVKLQSLTALLSSIQYELQMDKDNVSRRELKEALENPERDISRNTAYRSMLFSAELERVYKSHNAGADIQFPHLDPLYLKRRHWLSRQTGKLIALDNLRSHVDRQFRGNPDTSTNEILGDKVRDYGKGLRDILESCSHGFQALFPDHFHSSFEEKAERLKHVSTSLVDRKSFEVVPLSDKYVDDLKCFIAGLSQIYIEAEPNPINSESDC